MVIQMWFTVNTVCREYGIQYLYTKKEVLCAKQNLDLEKIPSSKFKRGYPELHGFTYFIERTRNLQTNLVHDF